MKIHPVQVAVFGFIALSITPTLATEYTWNGTTSGTWSSASTNWATATGTPWDTTNGPSNVAKFNLASLNASVSGSVSVNGLNFATAGTLGSTGTINLAGTSPSVVTSATGTVNALIAATNGFTKSGSAALVLGGNNTGLAGTVQNNAGSITLNHSGALGSASLTLATGTGTQVVIGTSGVNIPRPLTISGGTGAGVIGQGSLQYSPTTGTGTWSGDIAINGAPANGGTFGSGTGGELILTGNVTSLSSIVSIRTGVVTFSGSGNSFSNLNLSTGTIKVGAANALPNSAVVEVGNTTSTALLNLNGFDQSLAAVTTASALTAASTVKNDGPAAKTLTLTGATLNSVANTVIRNAATVTGTLTVADGTSLMGVTFDTGLNVPVIDAATLGVTINSAITSTNGFRKIGNGTLTLGADNSSGLSGEIAIGSGSVSLTNSKALGTSAKGTTVASGARVLFGSLTTNSTVAEPFNIAGTGVSNTGALNVGGSKTINLSGLVTLTGDSLLKTDGGAALNLNGGAAGNFNLTFTNDGSAASSISSLNLGSGSLIKTSTASLTLSGTIELGALVNNGSGSLTLTGTTAYATTATTSTGTTTIQGSARLGTGDVSIGTGSTLNLNHASATVANTLSGGGALKLSGAANVYTLSGDNSNFLGTVTALGTVSVSAENRLGGALTSSNATAIILNGGGIQATETFAISANRGIQISSNTTGTLNADAEKILTLNSNLSSGNASSNFAKTGAGLVVLSATPASATGGVQGTTTINTGTLQLGAGAGNPQFGHLGNGGAISIAATATLDLQADNAITGWGGTARALTVNGGNVKLNNFNATFSTITLNGGSLESGLNPSNYGSYNLAGNVTVTADSTISAIGVNSAGGNRTFDVASSRTLTISGSLRNGTTDGINQNSASSFTKSGVGLMTLSGSNTYTGTTHVAAGTLAIAPTGSLGNTTTTIATGATLTGGGILGGATTIHGIHSPGFSPGLQTFSGGLSYGTTASLNWELTANSVAGRGNTYDAIDVTGGSFALESTATIHLGFSDNVDFLDSFWASHQEWEVINLNGATAADSNLFSLANITGGLNYSPTIGEFGISRRPGNTAENSVFLTWTVVPEPTTALLGGLGLLTLVRRRRA